MSEEMITIPMSELKTKHDLLWKLIQKELGFLIQGDLDFWIKVCIAKMSAEK